MAVDLNAEQMKRRIIDLEKKLASNVSSRVAHGREVVMEREHDVEEYVKAHPMKSVGIAFMVGFMLGKATK
ncbi:MAG: hypothetical protein ABII22_02815 [Candidatus Micrarchaeota archaeon]